MSIKDQLFSTVVESVPTHSNKVSVIGTGAVGMATAFSILTKVCPQT